MYLSFSVILLSLYCIQKFDTALDLYAVLISEAAPQGLLYQGHDVFAHFRRIVTLFKNILDNISHCSDVPNKNRVRFQILRTLLSAAASSIDVRDALSDLGAFQVGITILLHNLDSDERLILWLSMFLSVRFCPTISYTND